MTWQSSWLEDAMRDAAERRAETKAQEAWEDWDGAKADHEADVYERSLDAQWDR